MPSWRTFPGTERVLAAQAAALPQPDQLCGPFAAHAALHAVLGADPSPTTGAAPGGTEVPSLVAIAEAAGTLLWPGGDSSERPAGAPPAPLPPGVLPPADSAATSGTDAAGLVEGIVATTGGAVAVVPLRAPAPGPWQTDALARLLGEVADAPYPCAVVANLDTGPVAPADVGGWRVGHFVVLYGVSDDGAQVAVADSYDELTAPGLPPGCRTVAATALAEALGAGEGRGLLVLADPEHAALLAERAVALGMVLEIWRT